MSQQSLTFLSQASTNLFKPPKPSGGTARFQPGIAGTMVLKKQTENSLLKIAEDDKENEYHAEATRPMRLCEYHYATSRAKENDRIRLGVLDLPPKPVGAIPGYSGFIPRKEAANVIGETYKCGNLQSAELFAEEQQTRRAMQSNILPPSSDLQTPQGF